MQIIIIDNRTRGADLQNQIKELDLPNIESVYYSRNIVTEMVNLHDNPEKIKDSDLVNVTNNSLVFIHGRNDHCGWYVQKINKSFLIPIIVYTGGGNYAKLTENQLIIDNKQYKISKPSNVLTVPQAVENADNLNLKEALLYLNEHPENIRDFFSLILGLSKKMRISQQLIHNCLTPDRINKVILNKGKLNNIIKAEGWLTEESITLIEAKIVSLAKQKDPSSDDYKIALNELKRLLLPDLYN